MAQAGRYLPDMDITNAVTVAAEASAADLHRTYTIALAPGGNNTGRIAEDERTHGPLELLLMALVRLSDLAAATYMLDWLDEGPDTPVARAAGDVSAGALRLGHRALEVHGRNVGYGIEAWIDQALSVAAGVAVRVGRVLLDRQHRLGYPGSRPVCASHHGRWRSRPCRRTGCTDQRSTSRSGGRAGGARSSAGVLPFQARGRGRRTVARRRRTAGRRPTPARAAARGGNRPASRAGRAHRRERFGQAPEGSARDEPCCWDCRLAGQEMVFQNAQ